MNPDRDHQQQERRRRPRPPMPETDHPPSTPAEQVETPPAEKTETPEAVRAARIAGLRGNSRERLAHDAGLRARGVEWVRPTDLLARQGAALAGRGIDFEVELARRTRTRTATNTGVRGFGDRARRLPPLSAFGRSRTTQSVPSRSPVG
ncbi:hypothetical protein G9U51_00965 [Calidifontibacter sp. DB0510]|uniref:Uncharacterized protein n=1 Tax=Metallococcus carri TaxID=1656884 RepID=A0A967AZ91_9MICO|nr:hypothetical protein [Metallococcus carri]NHN54355.1 hypothetical protein [Metallococcus carri]NOP36805.1 hypothetical protein [Calidifontibacter sp. DB2511S]